MVIRPDRLTDVPESCAPADVWDAIADLQRRVAALERERRITRRDDDVRYVELLRALGDGMGDLDLAFSAGEVIHHSRVDHQLDVALGACGLRTAAQVGAAFRGLRNRDLNGLRLVRDHRVWRLVRT
jgi:hypothetical protein